LIEVLVTVALIGLLVALLFPGIRHARQKAKRTVCSSDLRQIHTASVAYAHDNEDLFPHPNVTGDFEYRRAPGEFDPADPKRTRETLGLAAVLDRTRNLPGRNEVWICPAATVQMQAFKNTYGFQTSPKLGQRTTYLPPRPIKRDERGNPINRSLLANAWNTVWVWDNYKFYPAPPGLSGAVIKTSDYEIPPELVTYPHALNYAVDTTLWGAWYGSASGVFTAVNRVYIDGHVSLQALN